MKQNENLSLVSDLIVLAKADEKITAGEYDFILRLAKRMNVTPEEVDALFENPIPSKPLASEMERITHFYKLILVMNVDDETHEKEIALLKNFGLRMGIRAGVITQILHKMEAHDNKIIPTEDLLKIFQTYYN
ncbi:TerB family tellurite resistance protein [Patiriisocius hiemis]|uniref:TerB family tellurite resistance protein n=1 Tax=Patiriisocius hiemis TaxID=3075604 RepID=A0ABU2Y9R0_9FLAO|nr:TerB family tellurite resistance protein [Constantimarinum sp. W242]MDT0554576.1 TerB family tellurite resistance protein [Constantimarinum sp. W242]